MSIIQPSTRLVKRCPTAYRGAMNRTRETFGRVVSERMRARGMAPKELAAVIHRSESQVSLLLRDKVGTPPPDVVAALASHLGLDETRLVRLIGYLSTVPDHQERESVPFPPDDPRLGIVDLLPLVAEEDVAAVETVVRSLAGRKSR